MNFMEFVMIQIAILIFIFIIYEKAINKYEERIERLLRELGEYKHKEVFDKPMRKEFHLMKKWFDRYYPNIWK